jgi:hypothetical protein
MMEVHNKIVYNIFRIRFNLFIYYINVSLLES